MSEESKKALARYRINKAKENLSEANIMLESGYQDAAIGRAYYAIFTAARAALALKDKDSKKHSGVISLFNMCFIKTKTLPEEMYQVISGAKDARERADYADYVTFSPEEANDQLAKAKEFVESIEALIDEQTG